MSPPWWIDVPTPAVSMTRPAVGEVIVTGCNKETICGLPELSPKLTRDKAALPRTTIDVSSNIFKSASWKPGPVVSCPITQASVLRTSSRGFEASRTRSGYQRAALGSCRLMRWPSCTMACWMCRG